MMIGRAFHALICLSSLLFGGCCIDGGHDDDAPYTGDDDDDSAMDDDDDSADDDDDTTDSFWTDPMITSGTSFACHLMSNGFPRCWPAESSPADTPYGVGILFKEISAGQSFACGIQRNDELYCWGTNAMGQSDHPSGRFTNVTTGHYHGCALEEEFGTPTCWGCEEEEADFGQCDAPATMLTDISANRWHTCGITVTGSPICWGGDSYGQSSPSEDLPPLIQISTGWRHTCALTENGTPICWGCGEVSHGQCTPPDDSTYDKVVAGGITTCGLKYGSKVVCWGSDNYGQATPPDIEVFMDISVGSYHACGMKAGGEVTCWGLYTL